MAKAAAASQFPGFSRWVFAGEHSHEENRAAATKPAHYEAQFFSSSEYRVIDVLTEIIIPRDEMPGAHDAGVSEFIDFMAAHGEPDLRLMRESLQKLDNEAHKMSGKSFIDMSADQQHLLLAAAAARNADEQSHAFFLLLRRYTVMGYYTSRIGMEALEDPGLKFYTHSPACPHVNDPEHLHLPPPRY
jgi:hypothetical protein